MIGVPEFYAFACSVLWAVAVIVMRSMGDRVAPGLLNLCKNAVGLLLFVPTILLVHGWTDPGFTQGEMGRIVVSGVIGVMLADTLYLHSLNLLGAGRIAIVACLYSPLLTFTAYLFLADQVVTPADVLGFVLVVGGILIAELRWKRGGPEGGARLLRGTVLGVLAVMCMATAAVWIMPIIQAKSLLHITALRLAAGVAAGFLWQVATGGAQGLRALRGPLPWGRIALCGFLAAYAAMLFWIAGFRSEHTATAAVLNQLSTVFIIAFGVMFLRERLSWRKALGAATAVGGVLLVSLR